jgi:hypothetical protein
LGNDGESLIAIPEFGGPRAIYFDPEDGDRERVVFFFNPFGFVPEGHEALAVRIEDEETEYFPVLGDTVFRFDEIGRLIEDIEVVGSPDYTGAAFVGNILFLADDENREIHGSGIPAPPTVITTDPRGMATDGTDLFVVVDASPVDKIMKLDTSGELVEAFGEGGSIDSPGTETDGIAYHNGSLFVVTNDDKAIEDNFGGIVVEQFPVISEIDPETGDELNQFEIQIENEFGPPEILRDPIGALTSDGEYLYAGVDGTQGFFGTWFIIDPDNSFAPAEMVVEFSGVRPPMPGFESFEILSGDLFPANRELLATGPIGGSQNPADHIARFNKETGAMSDQYELPGVDITGTAYLGLTLYIADDEHDEIRGTSLPENTIELTVVGDYEGQLRVDVSPDLETFETTISDLTGFGIVRNPEVVVNFTEIEPDTGETALLPGLEDLFVGEDEVNFVLTDSGTTINGLVNDPAIDEVQVGIRLPFTSLLEDTAEPSHSENLWNVDSEGSASWHIQCENQNVVSSVFCSWRFGVEGQGHFGIGEISRGTLTSNDSFEVNHGTRLSFQTGYATEFIAGQDRKFVEVAPVNFDLLGNPEVGEFQPIVQIVGRGAGGAMPSNAHPMFQFVELDPLFINPNMREVVIDLSPLADFEEGQEYAIRFRFDSVNEFTNGGEGWFLDDITLSGEGFKSIAVDTELLDIPLEVDGVRFYRSFSTPFDLAEGRNEVGATGQQPYSPMFNDAILVAGFVDTLAPIVDLFGIPDATSTLVHTLQGSIEDATFQSLEVTQVQPNGDEIVIFSTSTLPEELNFSVPVSLLEGLNTFTAIVQDGGGLEGEASRPVIADITPPTASVEVVTVASAGEALVGDRFFITVAAQDNLSDIDSVVELSSGDIIVPVEDTPAILTEMHGLDLIGEDPVTHVQLSIVQSGTPVGGNTVSVRVIDGAGNEAVVNGVLNVVSSRSNRNFFLFPGVNFMGLALIPDDPSIASLLEQDVTDRVNPDLAEAVGGIVTLGDIIQKIDAFTDAGTFISNTPNDAAADDLTELEPFQGMIVTTLETKDAGEEEYDVFNTAIVGGFTAEQAVPIRINIEGVFFEPGSLPPDKTLRNGYNLIAPHILEDTLFDTVYRGALIPVQLAVSAISFDRRVDTSVEDGEIDVEIVEGFVTNSLGDFLKPVLSYWTFVVDNPNSSTPPTITP